MSENKCEGCFKRKECRKKINNILKNNVLKIYENMTEGELKKEFERQVLQWDLKFNNKTMTNVQFILEKPPEKGEDQL